MLKRFFVVVFTFVMIVCMNSFSVYADYVPHSVIQAARNNIVTKANTYIGVPYLWGGNDYNGIDCSGLCIQSIKPYVSLWASSSFPRNSYDIFDKLTKNGQGSAGDVFFDSSKGHMGICLGNGSVIHAPGTGSTVCVATYSNIAYIKRPDVWF